MSVGVNRKHKN